MKAHTRRKQTQVNQHISYFPVSMFVSGGSSPSPCTREAFVHFIDFYTTRTWIYQIYLTTTDCRNASPAAKPFITQSIVGTLPNYFLFFLHVGVVALICNAATFALCLGDIQVIVLSSHSSEVYVKYPPVPSPPSTHTYWFCCREVKGNVLSQQLSLSFAL